MGKKWNPQMKLHKQYSNAGGYTHTNIHTHTQKWRFNKKSREHSRIPSSLERTFITLFYFYGRLPNVENKNMSCLAKYEFQINVSNLTGISTCMQYLMHINTKDFSVYTKFTLNST